MKLKINPPRELNFHGSCDLTNERRPTRGTGNSQPRILAGLSLTWSSAKWVWRFFCGNMEFSHFLLGNWTRTRLGAPSCKIGCEWNIHRDFMGYWWMMVISTINYGYKLRNNPFKELWNGYINHHWLVVSTPLKNMIRQLGRIIPYIMEKCLKPPTSLDDNIHILCEVNPHYVPLDSHEIPHLHVNLVGHKPSFGCGIWWEW